MSKYRSTTRRSASRPAPGPRLLFAVVVIVGIVIGVRWLFSRNTPTVTTNQQPTISLINDVIETENTPIENSNMTLNANLNTNVSTNANTNASTSASTSTKQSALQCSAALSRISTTAKTIALTFDMAADNENVGTLLTALKSKNIAATFFVSGTFATKHPELTKKLATEFEVGNHGYATTSYAKLTATQVKQQILDTETAFQNALGEVEGQTPLLFRSPYGDAATTIVQGAKQAGYCTVLWTVDAFDWKSDQTASGAATRAVEKLNPGAIILFHAGYDITAEAVDQFISTATSQGYAFKTISQLLSTGGD